MKKLQNYYNEKYSLISIYVVKTILATFILGLLVYYLSGKTGGAVSFTSAVLKPLVLGLVLTYLLSPLVSKLQTKLFSSLGKPKLGRILSVILTYLIILAVIVLIVGIIVVTVTKSISSFNFAEIKDFFTALSNEFSDFWTTIEEELASLDINLDSIGDWLGRAFSGLKNGATTLLFAVIFSIYFLIDDGIFKYWMGVIDVFTTAETRSKVHEVVEDADKVFSGYIRGQAMDAALVGIMVSVALLIAGIPYAVVIGILTGIGNLIPYIGPVVGFVSLIIVCLAEASVTHLIIGGIILAAVMFVDANIINPRMLSNNVEVHPILVTVSLIAGGKIGGVVGMLVAVPVAALLKLQFEKFISRKAGKGMDPEEAAD